LLYCVNSSVSAFRRFKMKAFNSLVLIGCFAVCVSAQTQPPTFSTGQAARLVIGQTSFTSGNYGATNSLLGAPSGIAWANGTLWVADANRLGALPDNNRVLRFSDAPTWPSATQDPSIIGNDCGICRGVASLVLGQPDFISSNSSLTSTGLRNPTGVATDGNILAIADTDNNRILIWLSMPKSNGQPADVVVGQPDFTHNGTAVPPTATSLRGPIGVWIVRGKLFVADTQDNRVLIYNSIPTKNNVAADVVVGQPNFTSFVQPDLTQPSATTAANNMQDPVSVTTDPSGTHMFVADLGQSRVLIFNTIPTSNGASADVVIGQPDMVSSIDNNSFTVTNSTPDSAGNPTGEAGVLCQSNAAFAFNQNQTGSTAVDSAGNTIYPARCAATLSFPRFVLSDGTRLFIADGGNDRVLVFNSIPTTNGARADAVLGEPDEFTDNTGQNPDGSDAFQTPDALAWDGTNLYASDTYNNRVVVYTPEPLNIPLAAARNAASLQIYAIASVAIGGLIAAKDVVTIGINTTCTAAATTAGCYSYTVQSSDTLTTVTDALVKAINSKPDPNVVAGADDTTDSVVVTARQPGQIGATVTLMAITSANAQITAVASGATLNLYLQSPTSIAPGTLVEITGVNLCDNSAGADMTQPYLPSTLAGCEIFVDGSRAPLLYVSPTQVNVQMPWEFVDRINPNTLLGSISLYSRVTHADGSITVSAPIGVTIVNANPGIFAGAGNDPRPGLVYHAYSNAIDAFSIDGSATAGDKVTITIGTAPNATTTNSYSYTVQSGDTLTSVQAGLVNAINSAPDPNVIAIPANEFNRVIIEARVPGPAGEAISLAQSVSTNATESITIFNSATCCDNVAGTLVSTANPAQPGEIVYVFATGLGPTTPSDQNTGQVFTGGSQNPAATPVDSILAGGTAANILSAYLVPGLVGVYEVLFQLSNGQATDPSTQLTIAQQAHVSNVVVFPVGPATSSATPSIRRPTTQIKKSGSASSVKR
jgi:uncharacterized protein (TIGR03437 family)